MLFPLSKRGSFKWEAGRGDVNGVCVCVCDVSSPCRVMVLTTGLLRVELAPEEYQLYSDGCGSTRKLIRPHIRTIKMPAAFWWMLSDKH